MFISSTPLKMEVLRYFCSDSRRDIRNICFEVGNILKPYKNDEKIECIDRLVKALNENTGNIKSIIVDFKLRLSIEINVFNEVKDYEIATKLQNIKDMLLEFENDILSVSGEEPVNKNLSILLQAEKIRLFDKLFALSEEVEQELFEAILAETPEELREPYVLKTDSNQMYMLNPFVNIFEALEKLI